MPEGSQAEGHVTRTSVQRGMPHAELIEKDRTCMHNKNAHNRTQKQCGFVDVQVMCDIIDVHMYAEEEQLRHMLARS